MKLSIYGLSFSTLAIMLVTSFTTSLSAQASSTKTTQLECNISGSEKLFGDTEEIRDIVHIHVFEDSIPRVVINGRKIHMAVIGTNATQPSGDTAVGVNRSTEDVWNMISSNTSPNNWRFDNEVHINRLTGSITLRSISISPQGIRGTTEANGICSAMKEGQRKF